MFPLDVSAGAEEDLLVNPETRTLLCLYLRLTLSICLNSAASNPGLVPPPCSDLHLVGDLPDVSLSGPL